MKIEIIDTPIQFRLHGLSPNIRSNQFGEVGLKLMNEMWKLVKESKTANSGVNHWVYFPNRRMFVGVVLLADTLAPQPHGQTADYNLPAVY